MKKFNFVNRWLAQEKQQEDIFGSQFKAKLSIHHKVAVHPNRIRAARMLNSGRFEAIIGFVTIANFFMILLDTDYAADGKDTPLWLQVGNVFVLALLAWQNIFHSTWEY